jgi:hypothetical protein
MKKLLRNFFVFLVSFCIPLFAQTEKEIISKVDSSLETLVNIQKEIKNFHPCLEVLHPVAIVDKDSLLIFDFDKDSYSYKLIKKTEQPFPMPEGIQASFPLSVYDNKPVCVVSIKTFDTKAGYATIFHEFIHCCQYNSVEMEIKQTLDIYNNAMQNKDFSWEIMHAFPYDDSVFVNLYDSYKNALEENFVEKAKEFRSRIKSHLSGIDFEYMLWEEWKEGLARFIENKIRKELGIERNDYGKDAPYDRVAFYYSGELLIKKFAEINPELPEDIKLTYEKMKNFNTNE